MGFQEGVDCRLESLVEKRESEPISPIYIYYKIMGSNLSEAIQFSETVSPSLNLPVFTGNEGVEDLLVAKKQLVMGVCLGCQIAEEEIPFGLGVKRMRRDLREIAMPIIRTVGKGLRDKQQEKLVDYIARFYHPERKVDLMRSFTSLGEFFKELRGTAQKAGLKLPSSDQLLMFIQQLSERFLGLETPLTMFAVACPRFGENDEYDRLEAGVSQTAGTYLQSLPEITELLVKYQIPFKGVLLVNDTEDELLKGSLLMRLGLTPKMYHALCQGNVTAIQETLIDFPSHLRENLAVALFTEVFPQFKELVQRAENRFYQLMKENGSFHGTMVNTAKKRFEKHQRILGGSTDLDKHLYLTLHYAAEYMILGYLLRSNPGLYGTSFVVNYNSPNMKYFNLCELLSKTIQGEPNPEEINPIPVFQVKFY